MMELRKSHDANFTVKLSWRVVKSDSRKFTEPRVILNEVKNLCRFFVASLLRMTDSNGVD
jgi:hypothetical protein